MAAGAATLLNMCGGSAPMPAESPASAAPSTNGPSDRQMESAPSSYGQPGYPAQPSIPPPAPPPPAASSADGAPDAPHQREAARAELARAQADLDAAANDCSSACRALASMERATKHLCDLVSGADDQSRCDDARRRLQSSRDRVRSSCGSCS
jgi:hypothetical protein